MRWSSSARSMFAKSYRSNKLSTASISLHSAFPYQYSIIDFREFESFIAQATIGIDLPTYSQVI
ncbi:MAG: hypothetical protein WCK32_03940 [Chlorobiaceae bacterium]